MLPVRQGLQPSVGATESESMSTGREITGWACPLPVGKRPQWRLNAIRPSDRAPLLGHNLVRLLYLDEAGTDGRATHMCVAGVLVHGDHQWPEIDRLVGDLITKYIPESDRFGFIFHATERWPAKFGQPYKWNICLKAVSMPRIRSDHGTTSTTDA